MTDFIKTGVIGHPIAHSKSPLIHNYWINKYRLNGTYKAIDIHPDNLQNGVGALINEGYSGFNVTIPHKIAIMALCDEIDDLARKIGAVNTVTIKNGKLYGTNTDAYGFVQNIKANATDFDFTGQNALVLGAGGAANAVVYALLQEGAAQIIITNRTKEKAQKLAQLNPDKIKIIDWDLRNNVLDDVGIIINTTSLGMTKNPPLNIDISKTQNALVTDIVYAPLYTDLLKVARNNGIKTVTGIGMLLHQARPGFKLWNGVVPSVTKELEDLVLS